MSLVSDVFVPPQLVCPVPSSAGQALSTVRLPSSTCPLSPSGAPTATSPSPNRRHGAPLPFRVPRLRPSLYAPRPPCQRSAQSRRGEPPHGPRSSSPWILPHTHKRITHTPTGTPSRQTAYSQTGCLTLRPEARGDRELEPVLLFLPLRLLCPRAQPLAQQQQEQRESK